MSVPSIHHVQIAIPEGGEDTTRSFYRDIVGLTEVPKPEHLRRRSDVWFRTGNLDVHLGADRHFVPAGKSHVAFICRDLDKLRARLSAGGFAVVEDIPLPGFDRFFTTDPFGNRIELLNTM